MFQLQGEMQLRIWDVEHGACAMLWHVLNGRPGRLAMIDSGSKEGWRPSSHIKHALGRSQLDYLFITNADQDHMSDLKGLQEHGIYVPVLFRNPSYTAAEIQQIKLNDGPLSRDAECYVAGCSDFTAPVDVPFDLHMGGIQTRVFWNPYPVFSKTNDLSLVVFIRYGQFKILFPGDLEKAGWRALLARPDFRAELAGTNILVASHHGRGNGFFEEAFRYFTPDAVVISDKAKEHKTQETVPDYRRVVSGKGVTVRNTGKSRHVLTTRRDGWINIACSNDYYYIDTEKSG